MDSTVPTRASSSDRSSQGSSDSSTLTRERVMSLQTANRNLGAGPGGYQSGDSVDSMRAEDSGGSESEESDRE